MKSPCAILALLSLFLFAKTIDSRRDVGEYWKNVMKEQPIPRAIGGLLVDISDSTPKQKADSHEKVKKPLVEVEEFEPRPSATSYNDDETKAELSANDNAGPKAKQSYAAKEDKQSYAAKEDKQSFEEDFEPRPNISVYND